MPNPFFFGLQGVPAASGYSPNAVTFDSSDYLSRASDLVGSADGVQGLFSVWFKRTVSATEEHIYSRGASGDGFHVYFNSSDELVVDAYDVSAVLVMRIKTDTTVTDTNWHHIVLSFDLSNTSKRHIYLDGVSHFTSVVYNTAGTIEYTQGSATVCSRGDSFGRFAGQIMELYFHPTYLDLSVSSNLDKFRAAGAPADLATTQPSGGTPILYLKNAFGTFHQNAGSGGDFTVNGTLSAGSYP